MKLFKSIPKTVFQLGLVSLFNDLAKEMIYPVVPLFLTLILGAGPVALGLVESMAEATSAVLKVFSGISADRLGRRKPFLLWGYSISGLFRPMIALVQTWPAVLLFRFLDRMGKGLRSAPQDALIADVTNPSNLGASYGFHSAMDNAGQLLGPFVAALLVLPALGFTYQSIILWSIVPGTAAWLILLWVKDNPAKKATSQKEKKTLWQDWNKLGRDFKWLMVILALFTLGNSTDAFLIVRMSQLGVSASLIFALWGLNGGVRMLSSYKAGALSDRFGRKPVIVSGWLFYALLYLAFGLVEQKGLVIFLFLSYGLYYGICEPSEKAFIGDLAPKALRGTAFGYYYLITGLGALPASLIFGLVGQHWGYSSAFKLGAAFAGVASLLLYYVQNSSSRKT